MYVIQLQKQVLGWRKYIPRSTLWICVNYVADEAYCDKQGDLWLLQMKIVGMAVVMVIIQKYLDADKSCTDLYNF